MDSSDKTKRFSADKLTAFASDVLMKAGLSANRAKIAADVLVQADLMGHTTHGLALLKPYVGSLESGDMTAQGEPFVLNDCGSSIAWDGQYLPGGWLTHRAIDEALERIAENPVVTVTIQKSHHIGSLASYPERATERGLLMLLTCSDPNSELVAPYGGVNAVYSPNPIAAGIPTSGTPIIFDTSMSTTAWGVVNRAKKLGNSLPAKWLLDKDGNATADPTDLDTEPAGTILPIGGEDHGYKGFALGLLVEALTSGLAGHGRDDNPGRWGCTTFLQIIDPAAFGGSESFVGEMDHLSSRCRGSKTRPGVDSVRLPGERALALKAEQLKNGVALAEGIETSLTALAERFGVVGIL